MNDTSSHFLDADLLSVRTLARILDCSPKTVRDWLYKDRRNPSHDPLPYYRLRGLIRFENRWKRVAKRAGLKGLQFRDLRRTAATTLHDSGESLKTISAMLGHASVTTTIRYLGLKDENLKLAGDLLARKYRPLAQEASVKGFVQTVPETVPTTLENTQEDFSKRIDK